MELLITRLWFHVHITDMCVACFLQVFAYDYCFWSMDDSQKDKFAGWYIFTVVRVSLFTNVFPDILNYLWS